MVRVPAARPSRVRISARGSPCMHRKAEWGIFFIGKKRSKYFQKKFRGPKYKFFFTEHWHKASFCIKEQIRNWSFKNYYFGPPESVFLVVEEKTPKKMFSSCFGSDSASPHLLWAL